MKGVQTNGDNFEEDDLDEIVSFIMTSELDIFTRIFGRWIKLGKDTNRSTSNNQRMEQRQNQRQVPTLIGGDKNLIIASGEEQGGCRCI